jgi:prenyltransferase beta subunit
MSLHLEMLQVARLAPKVLGEACELVSGFLRQQQTESGGFPDREGRDDLYYTVFGLDSLLALEPSVPALTSPVTEKLAAFLNSFAGGEGLDFVHLCCLARCRAGLRQVRPDWDLTAANREAIQVRLETYRSLNGGFNPEKEAESGTAYGAFLGMGALRDLDIEATDTSRLISSLHALRTADGGFANEKKVPAGSTNATAAVVAVIRNLGQPMPEGVGTWLLSLAHDQGGFKAGPMAPMPDLLSTATSLHALSGLEENLEAVRDPCLDFIDTLWTNQGGFHGHWADDDLDVEYTFYGLLALGHLSVL